MGALIDKIAAARNLPSYTRPEQGDDALRMMHTLALDLAEDFRDLGLDVGVAWEGRVIRLNWPGGSDFTFAGISQDAFQLRFDRTRVVGRDELLAQIVNWLEAVQRELS